MAAKREKTPARPDPDEVLRRMLNTPPKPHKDKTEPKPTPQKRNDKGVG